MTMRHAHTTASASNEPRPATGRRWRSLGVYLVLLALLAQAGCGLQTTAASSRVRADGEGILSGVEVSQGPHSTISAVVEAETTQDAVVTVELAMDEGPVNGPPPSETATNHQLAVVGMRAETTYTFTVTAAEADGSNGSAQVEWTTGALPGDLPEVTVDAAARDAMAPGVTMFNGMAWGTGGEEEQPRENQGYLVAVDDEGEVVWYYESGPSLMEVSQTAQGTLLVQVHDMAVREIDVLGNTVRELATRVAYDLGTDFDGQELTTGDSEPVDIDTAHHELYQLDNGNLLTLSTELIELDPADAERLCPDNPEATIVGDVVVELSPDGEVVQTWPLRDAYDPVARPGNEMCVEQDPVAPPVWFYPEVGGVRDWTHANAVELDEESNRLMVSLRHLDAVVALRYHDDAEGPAGELLWELGPSGTLDMTDGGEWSYHQHANELQDDGSLLLYDNGNRRPGTGEGDAPPYSRAVLYQIDEATGTVTELWQHRDESADGGPEFGPFVGDADHLENGNVLVDHGGSAENDGTNYGRIVEVAPGAEPDGSQDQVVLDMTVGDGDEGWSVYRADRLASLYGTGEPAG